MTPVCDGYVLRKGASRTLRTPGPLAHAYVDPALQKSPIAGGLLSTLLHSMLRSEQPPVPIVPRYLVSSRPPPGSDQPAVLREDRSPGSTMGPGTEESFATSQERKVMDELKESVCEVYPRMWDDQCVSSVGARGPS